MIVESGSQGLQKLSRRYLQQQDQADHDQTGIHEYAPRSAKGPVEEPGQQASGDPAPGQPLRADREDLPEVVGRIEGKRVRPVQTEMADAPQKKDQDQAADQPLRHPPAARAVSQIQTQAAQPQRKSPCASSEESAQDPGEDRADAAAHPGQGGVQEAGHDHNDNERDIPADITLLLFVCHLCPGPGAVPADRPGGGSGSCG